MDEFNQLGCQVVVISCGTQESGMEWLQKHGYIFPLFIDRERVFYRQVGLRRFLKNSFGIEVIKHYADVSFAGTMRDEPPYPGSDLAVTGGDFIVDSTGKLLYAHLCKNQFDRPDIKTLIEFVQTYN